MRLLLSPPNLLTCVRIAMTPWVVIALVQGDCLKALWLSCIAGFTDAADGFLARRFGWSTRLGAYLDPIADKFLLTSLYVCFGIARIVPGWVVWLVVGRDILILLLAAGGILFTSRRDFPPTVWGKLSTVIQIAAVRNFSVGVCVSVRSRDRPLQSGSTGSRARNCLERRALHLAGDGMGARRVRVCPRNRLFSR